MNWTSSMSVCVVYLVAKLLYNTLCLSISESGFFFNEFVIKIILYLPFIKGFYILINLCKLFQIVALLWHYTCFTLLLQLPNEWNCFKFLKIIKICKLLYAFSIFYSINQLIFERHICQMLLNLISSSLLECTIVFV